MREPPGGGGGLAESNSRRNDPLASSLNYTIPTSPGPSDFENRVDWEVYYLCIYVRKDFLWLPKKKTYPNI